jgi:chemotaxis signal transduction protein
MKADPLHVDAQEPDPVRELRIVFAGAHRFGIFADEIEAIADWRTPTPLPQAPKSVLGIVCIHSRMLTVLDVAALLGQSARVGPASPSIIVALRGDEQLALAFDRAGEAVEIAAVQATGNDQRSLLLDVVGRGGETVAVFNTGELFAAAIRGLERRRRRF